MKIRPATSTDVLALAQVEQTQPLAAGWKVSGFESELKQKCALIMCAEQNDQVVGFVAIRFAADMAEIVNVAVHSEYVRRGIAKQLLQSINVFITQQSIHNITLEVAQDNLAACRLYDSFGFKPLHIRKDFYGPGKNAVLMGKKI